MVLKSQLPPGSIETYLQESLALFDEARKVFFLIGIPLLTLYMCKDSFPIRRFFQTDGGEKKNKGTRTKGAK